MKPQVTQSGITGPAHVPMRSQSVSMGEIDFGYGQTVQFLAELCFREDFLPCQPLLRLVEKMVNDNTYIDHNQKVALMEVIHHKHQDQDLEGTAMCIARWLNTCR